MNKSIVSMGVCLALVFGVAVNGYAFFGFDKYASVDSENGVVSIPVSEVDDGEAHYYVYDNGGRDVKFFLLKSEDGVIRAAFDACDVCFGEKKGYSQDGEFMVCNNCGQRFHSARINEVQGGCNPSPLTRVIQGGNVILNVGDIAVGGRYF